MYQKILVQDKIIQVQNPIDFATSLGDFYSDKSTNLSKKNLGQFFTPKAIAIFLADSVELQDNCEEVSILDPGAGLGILSCAMIEQISIKYKNVTSIKLQLYEFDKSIIPYLEKVLVNLNNWCINNSLELSYKISKKDFLIANLSSKSTYKSKYDIVISNPPYFKLSKKYKLKFGLDNDLKALPNAYSAFLVISERLLKPKGQLLFITPRSFSSGKYFNHFRKIFFDRITLSWLHVFEKRSSAFKKDGVLQEVVIFQAKKRDKNDINLIRVSNSKGIDDFNKISSITCEESLLIDLNSNERFLFLPTTKNCIELLKKYKKLTANLSTLHIKASTGPVVYFRNYPFLRKTNSNINVPFIWLNNVNQMNLNWPNKNLKRQQYFKVSKKSKSVLLQSKNYVLIRRFSAKGDRKRLIACPMLKNMTKELIAFENKLNYLEKVDGELREEEAVGLSAILCSNIYNQLFGMLNGNTNVSVSELQALNMPDLNTISTFGKYLKNNGINEENINQQVNMLFEQL
ncbi:MAG: N-6 DNA methylase [Maribacter sp.]